MNNNFTSKAEISINAPKSKVWEALTDLKILKQLYFGADIITDWKVDSPILYKGEWQGKSYEDKGTIIKFEREKLLVSTHWSPLSGVPDIPENYHTVTFKLSGTNGGTQVSINQDNNASEEEKRQSDQFWNTLLEGLKKIVES
jgi:uncharacterized protein YndB with AHSA1/START domain